jgi:hypothetical protein
MMTMMRNDDNGRDAIVNDLSSEIRCTSMQVRHTFQGT